MKGVFIIVKLIIGLGNPGVEYAYTRHNIGFMVIDALAKEKGITSFQKKFNGAYASYMINGEKVYILKPETYMNLSGECIHPFMTYFRIKQEEILVIYDDLDTKLGRLRLRETGSAGGHNGIKSVISHLGNQEFKRVRVGIGRPTVGTIIDYVLSSFKKEEEEMVNKVVQKSVAAIVALEEKRFSDVMNIYNQKEA